MIIYKATNKINQKSYIGQTTQRLGQRISEHRNRLNRGDRDHKFYLAMKKYGFDSFEWTIIAIARTSKGLDKSEVAFIKFFDTFDNGYNMTEGGDAISEETKGKIRNKLLGRKIYPEWTKKRLESWKRNGTDLSGSNNPNFGKIGKDCIHSKKYIITEPNGTEHIIHGLREWCRDWKKAKLYHGELSRCATGEYTHHHGYKCRYLEESATTIPKGSRAKWLEAESVPRGRRDSLNYMETYSSL